MSVANDQPIRIRVPHQHNAISRAIDELAREGFATRVTSKPDEPIIQYGDYSEWVLYITAVGKDLNLVKEILRKHGLSIV